MTKAGLGVFTALAIFAFSACTHIPALPAWSPVQDSLGRQQAELNLVAEVIRPSRYELIVRFDDDSLFGADRYSLTADAKRNLGRVTQILRRYPGFTIIIAGHTDNSGRESYNQWLSEKRAYVFADYLVESGVDPERIRVVGYGETQPIATNKTPEGQRRNRRVDLHIISELSPL